MKTYSILPAALLAAFLAPGLGPGSLIVQESPAAEAEAVAVTDDAQAQTGTAAAERLLERIEQAADELETLQCRVRYSRVQGLLGDEQRRFGDLYYAAANDDAPTRFAVHLDGVVLDASQTAAGQQGVIRPIDQWYIYDNRFLLERDHDAQTATRREMRAEDAEPDDTLALDSNSIPIPLQLKKDDVLADYVADRLEDDQLGEWTLHHLVLTPRAETAPGEDTEPLHLWFDSETLLLTKVVTIDGSDEIELIFAPSRMQPNAEIAPETFDTALPDPADGWSVQDVPLE